MMKREKANPNMAGNILKAALETNFRMGAYRCIPLPFTVDYNDRYELEVRFVLKEKQTAAKRPKASKRAGESLPATRLPSVCAYIDQLADTLTKNGRAGTSQNYRRARNSLSCFLDNKDMPFASFNEAFVKQYNEWLQRKGVVRNTASFYMRTLRAIYNKAVGDRLLTQEYPFRNVYTGIDRTRKRAVSEKDILQLQKADLSFSTALTLTRDLFIFSYGTRGMSFIDVALLKKENIRNGQLHYIRRKTTRHISVCLEPCIQEIVQRYWNSNPSSPYLFPLVKSEHPLHSRTQYQTALSVYNRNLKKLSALLGMEVPLSSYTARHTWATVAKRHAIPLTVISEGMGHTSEKTTRIYLAALEDPVIDKANQKILARLNKRYLLLRDDMP